MSRGGGMDCYRIWEAIYLKSIPIAEHNPHLDRFTDFPILFTQDYSEITPRYLEEQYEKMLEKEIRVDMLKWSYWKKRILRSIK